MYITVNIYRDKRFSCIHAHTDVLHINCKNLHNLSVCLTHNASCYTALQQNRQNVAASTHATTHMPSKPPARPVPPSVGMFIVLNVLCDNIGQFISIFSKVKFCLIT